jgi:hypothetical protein
MLRTVRASCHAEEATPGRDEGTLIAQLALPGVGHGVNRPSPGMRSNEKLPGASRIRGGISGLLTIINCQDCSNRQHKPAET